jgi:FkbM family methyltransferase
MEPKTTKIGKYTITFFNKEELKNLKEEIFKNEIYSINLNKPKKKLLNIFDVGAHIGLATLYFKNKFPNSRISCFEPNPNIFPLLEENIFYNNLKNIKTFNIALGNKSQKRKFYIDNSGYGAFSTASFKKDAWNGKQKSIPIKVRTQPLSKYIKSKVDLLKLDVEGIELEILKDLEENKRLEKIQNIIVEYHPVKGHKINNLLKILRRNGFNLRYSQDNKTLQEPREELILIVAKK